VGVPLEASRRMCLDGRLDIGLLFLYKLPAPVWQLIQEHVRTWLMPTFLLVVMPASHRCSRCGSAAAASCMP
jgi:hypothetical protein